MPNQCDDRCDCEDIHKEMMDEVDSKIESLKEYVDEKMREYSNQIVEGYLYHDQKILDGIDRKIKEKIRRVLFYILPPLGFLLLLALII